MKTCPYCKNKPIKKTRTCGHEACQHVHHILQMRKKRKTKIVRPKNRLPF